MRFAVISDIHGNSWALKAVLEDVERHSPDIIVNLGDSLYGPLQPMETYSLIKSKNIVSISGNEDRLIIDQHSCSSTLDFVIKNLNSEAILWLKSLPQTLTVLSDFLLCHGTPDSDTKYLIEDVGNGSVSVRNTNDLEQLLKSVTQRIILCGHSHLPGLANTPVRTIINPGSVGCPAFDDDHPVFHKVENFCNHAKYCLVETLGEEIIANHISVPYNYMKAVDCAIKNNRPDWAKWIKVGRV